MLAAEMVKQAPSCALFRIYTGTLNLVLLCVFYGMSGSRRLIKDNKARVWQQQAAGRLSRAQDTAILSQILLLLCSSHMDWSTVVVHSAMAEAYHLCIDSYQGQYF